jgi:acetylglutamate kinase
MTPERILIKLGGAALQSEKTLGRVAELIHRYRRQGTHVVLVHGGGPDINEELRRLGIEWTFIGGQRVTTPRMMEAIESTLFDKVNKRIVSELNTKGLPAAGVSGADHEILLCVQASLELGQVGKIVAVNSRWLNDVLSHATAALPVLAPLGVDLYGRRYNINADWAAAHVATALKVKELIFLTDMDGVLDEEGAKIPQVSSDGLRNMIEAKTVTGGMMTKCLAAIFALENGVGCVRILKGDNAFDIDIETSAEPGTICLPLPSEHGEVHDAVL